MDRKQWFIDRIGKRVFPISICDCPACEDSYRNGLIIENETEADHLYHSELDAQYDGCKLKHFDTKEERTQYETENNLK